MELNFVSTLPYFFVLYNLCIFLLVQLEEDNKVSGAGTTICKAAKHIGAYMDPIYGHLV